MRKVLLSTVVIAMIFAVIGCTSTPTQPTTTTQTLLDQTQTIPENYYWHAQFPANTGDTIGVDLNVTNGGSVDAFLMDSTGFADYQKLVNDTTGAVDSFSYYVAGSAMNISSKSYEFVIPTDAVYYIVIDNAKDNISGEAVPTGDVSVSIKITRTTLN